MCSFIGLHRGHQNCEQLIGAERLNGKLFHTSTAKKMLNLFAAKNQNKYADLSARFPANQNAREGTFADFVQFIQITVIELSIALKIYCFEIAQINTSNEQILTRK